MGQASACGLDGVPSISGNGTLAHRSTSRPSPGNLGHWAMFSFPISFTAGKPVRFNENTAELHRSLLPQAFGKPWHWSFGDGASASGFKITHIYKHAGDYKLVVTAYYANYGAWFQFDDAMIHVVAARTHGST
jgi:hypothetical protein